MDEFKFINLGTVCMLRRKKIIIRKLLYENVIISYRAYYVKK